LIDLQNSFTAAKSSKFPTESILGYHHTLSMLLHYLGKFKIRNFVLFVHVKRFKREFVSSIQQTSIKCHENNCKD